MLRSLFVNFVNSRAINRGVFCLKLTPMDVYEVIECLLDSNDGEINGRTAIQKLVYLSKQTIPNLDLPAYKAHYYGPYSSAVSIALEKLVSYSFVDERRILNFDYETYGYRLTEDGQQIVEQIKTKNKTSYRKLNNLVNTCKEFCGLRSAPLSYASKVFFTLEELPKAKRSQELGNAAEKAKLLGWDISEDDVSVGTQLLEKLKLV